MMASHGDRLIIEGIEAECRLGVHEWEQEKPQPIWIDLELAIDVKRAAAHDDVRDAVDYAALVAAVREEAQRRPVKLLETLTEAIAGLILEQFGTKQVRVRVKKKALAGISGASVEIERKASAARHTSPRSFRFPTAARPSPEIPAKPYSRK